MPSIILAIIGFVGGWCFCTALACIRFGTGDRKESGGTAQTRDDSGPGDSNPPEEAWLRATIGVMAFGFAVFVFVMLFRQAAGSISAYDAEETLVLPRISLFAASFALGIVCRAFKQQVLGGASNLLDIALVSQRGDKNAEAGKKGAADPPGTGDASRGAATTRYADRNLPWSIQAGLFVGLAIVVVLAVNPQIFRNITSFKAGSFEAHFASSTQWEIQAGQIALVDIDRKNMLKYLSGLDFENGLIWRDDSKATKLNRWRLRFAKSFISRRLSPVFGYLYCMESANIALSPAQKAAVASFAIAILNQIAADLNRSKRPAISAQMTELQPVADPDALITSLDLEMRAFAHPCSSKSSQTKKRSPAKNDVLMDISHEGTFNGPDATEVGKATALIWDPYLIRAAADLASYVGESRHAESLLEAVVNDRDYDEGLPLIERLSLWRAHLNGVVRSERPWPFDATFDRMSLLLGESRRQLDEHPPKSEEKDDGQETANDYYRKTRLSDLTLGLQLFYQRALLKQRFTPLQLEKWGEWLKEMRAVLDLLDDSYLASPGMSDSEKKGWSSAAKKIRKDRTAMQNAVTTTALSAVLLPAQKGSPDSGDCLSATKFLSAAKNDLATFFDYNKSLPDEKETYKGWLEQVGTLISNSCN